MIIVRLVGGLGNQMFQYAMGRSLALRKKTELKLDKSWLERTFKVGTPRDYRLHYFSIAENFATPEEIKSINNQRGGFVTRILAKIAGLESPYYKQSVLNEKQDFVFDSNVYKSNKDTYIQGYWNNEKYFKDIENIVRHEFKIKILPNKKNQRYLEKIRNCSSISIHVRRGDYVKDKRTNKHHGTCPLGYYKKAVNIIGEKVSNPEFFAFSDDPAWVKENLKIKYPIYYVDNNDEEHSYEDLRLMQNCKHNIIANSSFSWWGAWLNQNPNKIVIAPKKWLNATDIDTSDVVPKEWRRI